MPLEASPSGVEGKATTNCTEAKYHMYHLYCMHCQFQVQYVGLYALMSAHGYRQSGTVPGAGGVRVLAVPVLQLPLTV
jgi:hypothetical protein